MHQNTGIYKTSDPVAVPLLGHYLQVCVSMYSLYIEGVLALSIMRMNKYWYHIQISI